MKQLVLLTVIVLGLGLYLGMLSFAQTEKRLVDRPNQSVTTFSSSAATPVTLVELFTSEGCSSCPPAEEWLNSLSSQKDRLWTEVVPIAWHVDYWDRLGWPDRFAQAGFTERQRGYAAAWRSRTIYTPGVVINGREARGYHRGGELNRHSVKSAGDLQVKIDRIKGIVSISFRVNPKDEAGSNLFVSIAPLAMNQRTEVKRGENRGRTLEHEFVALNLQSQRLEAGESEGIWTAAVQLPAEGDVVAEPGAIAIWITDGPNTDPGTRILQATGGYL